jgi:hypothetical protein
MDLRTSWLAERQLHIDAFVAINYAFLILDIYLAHSANQFRHQAEYIPLWFSLFAPLVLLIGIVLRVLMGRMHAWNDLGQLVGWVSIVVGLVGVILHLNSQFFYEKTLKSLTYAAPFAAPLAYAGLGLLVVMNRMVRSDSVEWSQWLIALSLGGFLGNFVLSLTDHAVNGFYLPAEWIPVASAAFAVGFLSVPFAIPVSRRYLWLCAVVMALQAGVGVAGFFFHALANMRGTSASMFENVINGAPPMAPMLFLNLSLLGLYALWAYSRFLPEEAPDAAGAVRT